MDSLSFDNALARAQQMMLDENWQKQVSFAERQQSKKMNNNGGGSNDLAALEAQLGFGTSSSPTEGLANEQYTGPQYSNRNMQGVEVIQQHQRAPQTSRLPAGVRESFQQMGPLSGDDGISAPPASYYSSAYSAQPAYAAPAPAPAPRQPQMLNEQAYAAPQQGGGIDYNYIKYLIQEAIQENMKTMLNESVDPSMQAMRLGNGNKLQFIDSRGNIYEGVLTLKKKAAK